MPVRRDDVVRVLLERHGRTYLDDVGPKLTDGPAPLFGLLVLSLLLSARISSDLAVAAARALRGAGWTSAARMASASWADRTRVLNRSGYARYDERTSRMLGDTATALQERYGGDLRRLHAEADGDMKALRRLLTGFNGMGGVGANIFLREVQGVWDDVYPFVDDRTSAGAKQLGLPSSARGLSGLVPRADFPRLVAACIRSSFATDADDIRHEAARSPAS